MSSAYLFVLLQLPRLFIADRINTLK
jgi:hypothetical protein